MIEGAGDTEDAGTVASQSGVAFDRVSEEKVLEAVSVWVPVGQVERVFADPIDV